MRSLPRENKQNSSAREIAIDALMMVEDRAAYSNLALQSVLKDASLEVRDKALVTELVYGTIQNLNRIDYDINYFLKKRKLSSLDSWLRQLLRLAIYQIRYLDNIPDHAIAYESVEIAKRRGHQGIASMVNGVIRSIMRSPDLPDLGRAGLSRAEWMSLHYKMPLWLMEKWSQELEKKELEKMLVQLQKRPKLTVRRNSIRLKAEEFHKLLDDKQIKWKQDANLGQAYHLEGMGDISNNGLFQDGLMTVQDTSSMLVGLVANPGETWQILDACAAPGGKTSHLAELQMDRGNIIANDLHNHKLKLIQAHIDRLGLGSIRLRQGDFLEYPLDDSYDLVLLDAPCSGLGVIQSKPDLKWRMDLASIESIVALQRKMIRHAAKLVKPGGYLIYSTCTINPDENQFIVEDFLSENSDFTGTDIREDMPEQLLSHMKNNYSIQILPHYLESDGFYIAKLRKDWK